jgi:hypothetical protein
MRIPKTVTLVFVMAIILVSFVSGGLFASGPSDSADSVALQRPARSEGQAGAPAGALSTPQLIEAAQAKGQIDRGTANLYLAYAFADPGRLPAEYHSHVPWDGTLPLLRLRESVKTLAVGPERSAIESMLTGDCGSSTGTLPNVADSTHFHVEYGTIGGGLAIGDYTASLETTWGTEVTSFGWASPPVLASNPPPGDRYHVRIDSLGGGLYGYVTNGGDHAGYVGDNPATTWNEGDAYATCMVLNADYSGFPGTPEWALQATAAHEFNHSIQFGYGALTGTNEPDINLVEASSTWMEDEVFDSANDNYNYLWPNFAMCMGEYTASPYPYWITLRGLTERYGTGAAGGSEQVIQDFWEETSQSTTSNMLTALNTALANKGTTLADAYHAYAIAVKFNKSCSGGYVYPYCLEEGPAYVSARGPTAVHGSIASIGGSYSGSLADYYALNWISLPTSGGTYTVTLKNNSSGGQLRASVVCDTGSALDVDPLPDVLGAGGSTALAGYDPSGCTAVVAVITNQAQTIANPTSCTARSYTLTTGESAPPAELENGDFESGPTAWQEYSANDRDLIVTTFPSGVTPHGGSWAAWLGRAHDETAYIRQQVIVPPGATALTYWHWILSEDWCGWDFGRVLMNGVVVDDYDLCTDENTGGWVKHSVDVSAYAGQTVSLQIEVETDGSYISDLVVDDVSFVSSTLGELEPVAFLPIVMKRWPPIPDVPVLNTISNSDQDGDYKVDWESAYLASWYELQEDDNSAFSSPATRYSGSSTYYWVNDKPVGTWYYRVRGCNSYGCSGWSVTRSTAVLPPRCLNYVDNDTGGTLEYEVKNTGIGKKSFSGGVHYYGSFPAGTYTYCAKARCGSNCWTDYFPVGEVTITFRCTRTAILDSPDGLFRLTR